jgi:hypothetical protein
MTKCEFFMALYAFFTIIFNCGHIMFKISLNYDERRDYTDCALVTIRFNYKNVAPWGRYVNSMAHLKINFQLHRSGIYELLTCRSSGALNISCSWSY